MRFSLQQWIQSIIKVYLQNEAKQIVFPTNLILLLRIQYALLNLSYIFTNIKDGSYFNFIIMFARPQIFLQESQIAQYFIFIFCILHIMTMFSIIRHTVLVGLFSQLIRCGMLNFFFEYTIGNLSIITRVLLLIISLMENLIFQGTLDVKTTNFQRTRFTILDLIGVFLNYILMIFYSYNFSSSIIAIIAISLNLLRTIIQLVFSSFKTITTKTCVLTIKILTIYMSIFWILNLENKSSAEIVLIPLLYKIIQHYYQQKLTKILLEFQKNKANDIIQVLLFLGNIDINKIIVVKPKNGRDKVIYATYLMFKELNYQAFLELQQIKYNELSLLDRIRKQIIVVKCLNKIYNSIEEKQTKKNMVSIAVSQLMQIENRNQEIQFDLCKLIKEKINCLKLLTNFQNYQSQKSYLQYTHNLFKYKIKLENQYKEFPNEKIQCILSFFYAEIMNDYLSAYLLSTNICITDDKTKQFQNSQDNFSNNMIYLITKFDGKLLISKASNEASQLLKIPLLDLINMNVSQLIPESINEIHDQLVLNFLKTGESKYMRQINTSFLINQQTQTMNIIELFYEINPSFDISFIVFLQMQHSQTMTLILNNNLEITCMSDLLIDELDLQSYYKQFYFIHITKIIPHFNIDTFQNVTEAYFDRFDEHTQTSSQPKLYYTSFTITEKKLNNKIIYYIINFDYFKKIVQNTFSRISNYSPTIKIHKTINMYTFNFDKNDIDEDSQINIPYEEKSQVHLNCSLGTLKQYDQDLSYINSPKLFIQEGQRNSLDITNLTNLRSCKQNDTLLKTQNYFIKQNEPNTITINIDQEREINKNQSSIVSSLQGIRNSKYFLQMVNMQKISQSNPFTKQHKIFLFILIISIMIQLCIQIIQLIQLNICLTGLATDIDLLQVKNYVFQPLDTFLLTRWSIFNYNQLRDDKLITIEEYDELAKFPKSHLSLGYDQLDENLKLVINRPALQDFLENNLLKVYEYISTNIGEIYTLSLRNAINILKNYEYDFKMAFLLDGTIVADSPYVYFQYKNYMTINNLFTELNEIVLIQTIQKSQQIEQQIQFASILSFALCGLLFSIVIYYFLQIHKIILKHFKILDIVSNEHLEFEINYLKQLEEIIAKDQISILKYTFRLENKEKQLSQNQNKQIIKKKISKLHYINCHQLGYWILFIFILAISGGNSILTYYEGLEYLLKYPQTATFYKAVSDVGTDVPNMFAQREVLYGRNVMVPYFTEADIENLEQEILDSLQRTKNFTQINYNFDEYLVSNSFDDFFQAVSNDNLCDYLPQDIYNSSIQICPNVMNQILTRGLSLDLVYITNYINTDYEINHFTIKTQESQQELEGAFIISNVIKVINTQFNQDLVNVTKYWIKLINLHNIIMLIILCGNIAIISLQVKKRLIHIFYLCQRMFFLLPQKTLMLDSNFDRNIRQLFICY